MRRQFQMTAGRIEDQRAKKLQIEAGLVKAKMKAQRSSNFRIQMSVPVSQNPNRVSY